MMPAATIVCHQQIIPHQKAKRNLQEIASLWSVVLCVSLSDKVSDACWTVINTFLVLQTDHLLEGKPFTKSLHGHRGVHEWSHITLNKRIPVHINWLMA